MEKCYPEKNIGMVSIWKKKKWQASKFVDAGSRTGMRETELITWKGLRGKNGEKKNVKHRKM